MLSVNTGFKIFAFNANCVALTYAFASIEPSAFKNSAEVPPALTKDVAVTLLPKVAAIVFVIARALPKIVFLTYNSNPPAVFRLNPTALSPARFAN